MPGALEGQESVGSPGTRITDSYEPPFVCWESNGLVGRNSQCLPTELSLQLCLGTFTSVQTLGSEYAGPAVSLEECLTPEESKARVLVVCATLCAMHWRCSSGVTDSVPPASLAGFRPGQGGRRSFIATVYIS